MHLCSLITFNCKRWFLSFFSLAISRSVDGFSPRRPRPSCSFYRLFAANESRRRLFRASQHFTTQVSKGAQAVSLSDLERGRRTSHLNVRICFSGSPGRRTTQSPGSSSNNRVGSTSRVSDCSSSAHIGLLTVARSHTHSAPSYPILSVQPGLAPTQIGCSSSICRHIVNLDSTVRSWQPVRSSKRGAVVTSGWHTSSPINSPARNIHIHIHIHTHSAVQVQSTLDRSSCTQLPFSKSVLLLRTKPAEEGTLFVQTSTTLGLHFTSLHRQTIKTNFLLRPSSHSLPPSALSLTRPSTLAHLLPTI